MKHMSFETFSRCIYIHTPAARPASKDETRYYKDKNVVQVTLLHFNFMEHFVALINYYVYINGLWQFVVKMFSLFFFAFHTLFINNFGKCEPGWREKTSDMSQSTSIACEKNMRIWCQTISNRQNSSSHTINYWDVRNFSLGYQFEIVLSNLFYGDVWRTNCEKKSINFFRVANIFLNI
jgi:hypothetical protein